MPEITLNGPVVRAGAHNVILRDALLHSPIARERDADDYHVFEVGIREGESTSWIGISDGSRRRVPASRPASILESRWRNKRLREGQAIVVKIEVRGVPQSLKGSRINFRLGRVGGRDGPERPLVSTGLPATDPNARTALADVSRQINDDLAGWEESVALIDPVELAPTTSFQGRLQVDSTTEISMQRYIGNWIEVDGDPLSITSSGLSVTSTSALLESNGAVGTNTPGVDTTYNVYVGGGIKNVQIRLSSKAPTKLRGTYYLGTVGLPRTWRFCGWVRSNSSTQFVDSEISRLLCNYYNRLLKDLFRVPGYVDNDATTTYTETSTTWTAANAGAGSQVEFISNGEDAAVIHGTASVANSGAGESAIGIGIDSVVSASRAGSHAGTLIGNIALHYSDVLSSGRHTADLLTKVSSGTATYRADEGRDGSDADPPVTYISGQVLV